MNMLVIYFIFFLTEYVLKGLQALVYYSLQFHNSVLLQSYVLILYLIERRKVTRRIGFNTSIRPTIFHHISSDVEAIEDCIQ